MNQSDAMICLTFEQATELLDYLDAAGHAMSEYGYTSEAHQALERFKAMLNAKIDAFIAEGR